MEKITSLTNQTIKNLVKLHTKKERDKTNTFLIEGDHLIEESVKHNVLLHIYTDKPEAYANYGQVTEVTPQILQKLSANISDAHVIGVCRKPTFKPYKENRLLLLDNLQDPGNLGTLIRTAVSFGFDAVICNRFTCDAYSEKVIRSTQGALFQIPIVYTSLQEEIPHLKQRGVKVIATSLRDAIPMKRIDEREKMAFVLGNEGQGVSLDIINEADERLFIEMAGFESLNVAVAGGIVMYRFSNTFPNRF